MDQLLKAHDWWKPRSCQARLLQPNYSVSLPLCCVDRPPGHTHEHHLVVACRAKAFPVSRAAHGSTLPPKAIRSCPQPVRISACVMTQELHGRPECDPN